MSSIWEEVLHQASFGGVQFDCLTTRDSIRRSVIRRVYPRRDGGHLQDMGSEPRETQVQAIFFERRAGEGEDNRNHLVRFRDFFAATQRGYTQDFVHPITGRYRAMVDDFDFDADGQDEDMILVNCTFVEDSTEPAVFVPGAGMPLDAGTSAVRVQAEVLEQQLAVAGFMSPIPDFAAELAELWESSRVPTLREVNLGLATISAEINDAIDEYQLVTDLDRYPVWRSMQRLLYTLRRAAESFRQSQPQLTTITILRGQPLRRIVAEHYGATDAEDRYDEIIRLNDLDDPSYVPEGTRLRAPVAEASRREAA